MAKPFFTVEITNIRDIAGVFRSMADKGAVNYARELLRESGRILVKELKEEAPVGKHYTWQGEPVNPTQRLRDSFFYRTFVRGKTIWMGVYVKPSQAKKLGWVIRGTSPFKRGRRTILPVKASVLSFYWARKKKSMAVKFVRHPGSLPNPFHERALKKAQPKIEKLQRKAARNIAQDMFMKFPQGLEVI